MTTLFLGKHDVLSPATDIKPRIGFMCSITAFRLLQHMTAISSLILSLHLQN